MSNSLGEIPRQHGIWEIPRQRGRHRTRFEVVVDEFGRERRCVVDVLDDDEILAALVELATLRDELVRILG